eukprot:TRINITY_DN3008_c0_g1_i2.p1 TRINITY_DN3008_c0_g1~~TRINITY_DN3008_c0_g1_i2.p1  ORF type:complete len:165 (-),score=20.97 TRINITY_DN3008_c0_g1_i2:90-584(-)
MTTKVDAAVKDEVGEWLGATVGKPLPPSWNVYETLKDGILLCELINKLKPGSITKVNKNKVPFMQMENIGNYVRCASTIFGVEDRNNFVTVDLYENKNIAQVLLGLVTLKRKTGHGFKKATAAPADDVFDTLASPSVATKRFCPHCGEKHPEAAKFCPSCGKAI